MPTTAAAANHGIYWIDRFGNKELIYRDPAIACVSPIPLRRGRPPVLPTQTTRRPASARPAEPPLRPRGVMKSTTATSPGPRHESGGPAGHAAPARRRPHRPTSRGSAWPQQTNARAVLGSVPVEADGSAYFEAPAGKPIYFQALDGRGLAVQSMRSVNYLHPGETLSCQGCHEAKASSAGPICADSARLAAAALADPARPGRLQSLQLRPPGPAGA